MKGQIERHRIPTNRDEHDHDYKPRKEHRETDAEPAGQDQVLPDDERGAAVSLCPRVLLPGAALIGVCVSAGTTDGRLPALSTCSMRRTSGRLTVGSRSS